MAVRVIDVTEHERAQLRVVEPVVARGEIRRLRQRWGLIGVLSLSVPFVVALATLFAVR
jgi:hypothetical protein